MHPRLGSLRVAGSPLKGATAAARLSRFRAVACLDLYRYDMEY
jgi:hypothetical protein